MASKFGAILAFQLCSVVMWAVTILLVKRWRCLWKQNRKERGKEKLKKKRNNKNGGNGGMRFKTLEDTEGGAMGHIPQNK